MTMLEAARRHGAPAVRALLCVVSAVLMAGAFAPFNYHWLVWVGFVPLLFALRGASARHAAAYGGLFGLAFFALTVHWLWNLFGMFCASLFVISAIFPALFGSLQGRAAERFSPGTMIALTPTLWVACEFLRAECWALRFGWGALGYSQVQAPLVMQSASVVGVYGITWLIIFANALLFWTLTRPVDRGVHMMWMLGSVFAAGVKLSDGACHRRVRAHCVGMLTAGCVQGEEVGPGEYERVAADAKGARLLVLPEYALMGDPAQDPDGPAFVRLARERDAYVVFGCKRYTDDTHGPFHNTALVLDPRGEVVGEYAKRNPVPFFNDGKAGRRSVPVHSELGAIGLAVCYDADFERPCREAVFRGAQILAIPTFDARLWGEAMHRQHEAMPRMRAVETGRYVLRSASSGYSMIVNPHGEVLSQATTQNPEAITGAVCMQEGLTPYVRWGWLLARVCVLIALATAFGRRRRGAV